MLIYLHLENCYNLYTISCFFILLGPGFGRYGCLYRANKNTETISPKYRYEKSKYIDWIHIEKEGTEPRPSSSTK